MDSAAGLGCPGGLHDSPCLRSPGLGEVLGHEHAGKEPGSGLQSSISSVNTLKCICWNVAGLYSYSHKLRIIQKIKADIVCIVETHLQGAQTVDLLGYTWFGKIGLRFIESHIEAQEGWGYFVRMHYLVPIPHVK